MDSVNRQRLAATPWARAGAVLPSAVALAAVVLAVPVPPRASAQSSGTPLAVHVFGLETAGKEPAYFTSVRMIGSTSAVIELPVVDPETGKTVIRKTPGPTVWHEVTLTRSVTNSTFAAAWRRAVEDGRIGEARRDCAVVAYDVAHKELARWEFLNAWPSRVAAAPAESGAGGACVESLTFVHEGCVRGTLAVRNHYPRIALPGPHVVPVLGTTNFPVTVSDPDGDIAQLICTLAPGGATFDGTTFTWTAALAHVDTVQTVRFRADDRQGTPTSVVDAETTLAVPFDSDTDALGDGWEVVNFGDLSRSGAEDADDDGASNAHEYTARTDPTRRTSVFRIVSSTVKPGTHKVALRFTTEPAMVYMVEFTDDALSDPQPAWRRFADTNRGVIAETSTAAAIRMFVDDLGPATTGGLPPRGQRYYRIRVSRP